MISLSVETVPSSLPLLLVYHVLFTISDKITDKYLEIQIASKENKSTRLIFFFLELSSSNCQTHGMVYSRLSLIQRFGEVCDRRSLKKLYIYYYINLFLRIF